MSLNKATGNQVGFFPNLEVILSLKVLATSDLDLKQGRFQVDGQSSSLMFVKMLKVG